MAFPPQILAFSLGDPPLKQVSSAALIWVGGKEWVELPRCSWLHWKHRAGAYRSAL
jgi:hypothetical protein